MSGHTLVSRRGCCRWVIRAIRAASPFDLSLFSIRCLSTRSSHLMIRVYSLVILFSGVTHCRILRCRPLCTRVPSTLNTTALQIQSIRMGGYQSGKKLKRAKEAKPKKTALDGARAHRRICRCRLTFLFCVFCIIVFFYSRSGDSPRTRASGLLL